MDEKRAVLELLAGLRRARVRFPDLGISSQYWGGVGCGGCG